MTKRKIAANNKHLQAVVAELCALEVQAGIDPRRVGPRSSERHFYFTVPNLDLRKALIVKSRECDAVGQHCWDADVTDAQMDVIRAKRLRFCLPVVVPAICATFLIGVGWHFLAIPGALAGAVAALFLGLHCRDASARNQATAIARAESHLVDRKQCAVAGRHKEPMFTSTEAETGEPDEPDRAVA